MMGKLVVIGGMTYKVIKVTGQIARILTGRNSYRVYKVVREK